MGPKAMAITRDVRMVYSLFIEELRGAVPGRAYKVTFTRGEKIAGATRTIKADEDGIAQFKHVSEFTATLQVKNASAYKKKDLVLQVVEVPSDRVTCEARFNIAGVVVNEQLPLKQLMAKSDTGEQSLWFGLSGVSEDTKLNAARASPMRSGGGGGTSSSQAAMRSSPDDTEDYDASLIDEAIDQANSGRKPNSARKATPNSSRAASAAPPPLSQQHQQSRNNYSSYDDSAQRSPSEDAPPPQVVVKKSRIRTDSANFSAQGTAAFEPREEEQPAANTRASPSVATNNREVYAGTAAKQQQQQQPGLVATSSSAAYSPPSSKSANTNTAASRLPPQSPPSGGANQPNVSENARWLAAIADAAASAAAAATATTARSQVDTQSFIPRASLLILSPLRRWTGERRLIFAHDFVLYLYQDVLRHTRHHGAWINILIHVLYDSLGQVEALESEEAQRQQEDDEQEIADELLEMLDDKELINDTLQKSYMNAAAARDDVLSQLLRDWMSGERTPAADKMGSALVVIISVTIDDVLRRLCTGLAKRPLAVIKQAAVPPSAQPAWATADGYTIAVPLLRAREIAKRGGNSGNLTQHLMVEDANVALVMHTLDALYDELLPPGVAQHPPLMRLCTIEIFKLVVRNVTSAYLNNLTKDGTFVVRAAKDALHLKMTVTLLERWLQEHQLFMSCRGEFLPLRQFVDVAIMPKRMLLQPASRADLAKHLPAPFLYHFLRQFEPNPRDLEADTVPGELLRDIERDMKALRTALIERKMKKAKEEGSQQPNRRAIEQEADAESTTITQWKYQSLGNFPFFDFLYGLLPSDDADGGAPGGLRKSTRQSVRMSIRRAHPDRDPAGAASGKAKSGGATNAALDWDVQLEYIATAEDVEAIFPGNENKDFVNVRLAALSLPNAEQLDEIEAY